MPHTYFLEEEMEIERKFLINDLSKVSDCLSSCRKKDIVQNYLYKDIYSSIRKRLITEERANKVFLYDKDK